MTDGLEQRLRELDVGNESPPDILPVAAQAGLVDVAYASHDTPLGRLLLAATPVGLVRVAYLDGGAEAELEQLARRLSPRVLLAPRALERPRRELDEYFSGRRTRFEIPLDRSLTRGAFARRVLEVTSRIPFGRTSSYKAVAIASGSERGFRAAGGALGSNPLPIVVPCHRVLTAGGGLGGYTGGLERKLALLEVEGVVPRSLR